MPNDVVTFDNVDKVKMVQMDSGKIRLVIDQSSPEYNSTTTLQLYPGTARDVMDIAEFREDTPVDVERHMQKLPELEGGNL